MKMLLLLVLFLALPAAGEAQFSSDFPGVPRAALTHHGSTQGRFALDFTGMRFSSGIEGETTADSLAASARMGVGRSWRIGSNWEVGFDFSLAEGRIVRPSPEDDDEDVLVEDTDAADPTLATTLGYGLRLGAKLRPLAYVDPNGYGISAAVGFAVQPGLAPVITHWRQGDSVVTGGFFGADDAESPIQATASTQFMAALSYRSSRAEVDAAVVVESLNEGSTALSATPVYDGTSIRLGARYRLTRSFAVGAVYWGAGAPPWRDQVPLGAGLSQEQPLAVLFSFGPLLEQRTDLIISSPDGNFSESISLHLRVR